MSIRNICCDFCGMVKAMDQLVGNVRMDGDIFEWTDDQELLRRCRTHICKPCIKRIVKASRHMNLEVGP